MHPFVPNIAPPAAPADSDALGLQSFSYEDRRVILPALSDALSLCGCWVLERKAISLTQMEVRFEFHLRSVLELYSALIASGLELTRAGHLDLTGLCTLRHHNLTPAELGRVLRVRLEISFLDELDLKSILMPGAALA